MSNNLKKYLQSVHAMPSTGALFNPWRDYDKSNDLQKESPEHRLYHLTRYMEERAGKAKYALIAESPGWRGCKFSGCAMSSERDLIREQLDLLDFDGPYFSGQKYRTSKVVLSSGAKNIHGMIEPTATVAWRTMIKYRTSREFVLWNAQAFHPHEPGNMLTNRTPTQKEVTRGMDTLRLFLDVFPSIKVVAVGKISMAALKELGVPFETVRHPAYGGAPEFEEGIARIFGQKES